MLWVVCFSQPVLLATVAGKLIVSLSNCQKQTTKTAYLSPCCVTLSNYIIQKYWKKVIPTGFTAYSLTVMIVKTGFTLHSFGY